MCDDMHHEEIKFLKQLNCLQWWLILCLTVHIDLLNFYFQVLFTSFSKFFMIFICSAIKVNYVKGVHIKYQKVENM